MKCSACSTVLKKGTAVCPQCGKEVSRSKQGWGLYICCIIAFIVMRMLDMHLLDMIIILIGKRLNGVSYWTYRWLPDGVNVHWAIQLAPCILCFMCYRFSIKRVSIGVALSYLGICVVDYFLTGVRGVYGWGDESYSLLIEYYIKSDFYHIRTLILSSACTILIIMIFKKMAKNKWPVFFLAVVLSGAADVLIQWILFCKPLDFYTHLFRFWGLWHIIGGGLATIVYGCFFAKKEPIQNDTMKPARSGMNPMQTNVDTTDAGVKARFCSNCGNQLSPGAVFCGQCGTRVV